MTTDGDSAGDPFPATVLVQCTDPPSVFGYRCVDVRPGTLATFDGDRVSLPLTVRTESRRTRVSWRDVDGLERAVAGYLVGSEPTVLRFGDRAACRAALGPAGVGTIERRLAATARAGRAALLTWTTAEGDREVRGYDAVIGAPAVRSG
ncbi:MAG: hypothetical protein ABEJ92_11750 [Halobacteriales archaeon]